MRAALPTFVARAAATGYPARMLLFLLACTEPTPGDTSRVADSGDTDDIDDTDDTDDTDTDDTDMPDGLTGTAPAEPVSLPTFTARNQLGESRSEADLSGHPTVLWFYPAAGTYG